MCSLPIILNNFIQNNVQTKSRRLKNSLGKINQGRRTFMGSQHGYMRCIVSINGEEIHSVICF